MLNTTRTCARTTTISSRFRRVVGGVVGSAVVLGTVLNTHMPASAATHENVLRSWCTRGVVRECTVRASDDDGAVFISRAGHKYQPTSERAALRYLRAHAVPCREEDSPACVWDAGVAGDGRGSSFFVVGGHREGEGVVMYTQLV